MNAITVRQPVLQPQSFNELVQFAKMAAESTLVPKDYAGKPANVMLAVQMGSELGLSPMQAIQNISVINGRPAVWGDAMLGLVKSSPLCQDVVETLEGTGDARVATCIVRRKGASEVRSQFSAADAKRAGLLGKPGPWQQYPDRMLQMRARGFALRDAFPDVLRGLVSAEEAQDTPQPEQRLRITSQPVRQLTASEELGDSIPALDNYIPTEATPPPPPKPDPLVSLRAKLAACVDYADVVRVADAWQRAVDKAKAAGRPFSDEVIDTATELLADRMGEVPAPAPAAPSLDEELEGALG